MIQAEMDDKLEVVPYEQLGLDGIQVLLPYERLELDDRLVVEVVVVGGMQELSSYEQGKGLLILLQVCGRV